jgi:hypothetical protein
VDLGATSHDDKFGQYKEKNSMDLEILPACSMVSTVSALPLSVSLEKTYPTLMFLHKLGQPAQIQNGLLHFLVIVVIVVIGAFQDTFSQTNSRDANKYKADARFSVPLFQYQRRWE